MLIEHMKQGLGIEAFGTVIHVGINVLYRWLEEESDFREARNEGAAYLHRNLTTIGYQLSTGQLKRLKSEKPMIGTDGKPLLDPKTGEVLYDREYEPTTGNAASWIFLCKNLLGWRNENHVTYELGSSAKQSSDLTPEERMKEISEMTKALEEIENAQSVIDITPKRA